MIEPSLKASQTLKGVNLIKIISPEQFKKTLWKNGKGETTELAISDAGTLDDFDWRISMATVVEDGPFSYFTGYLRNLILIGGNGMDLQHDQSRVDRLDRRLSFATFDGVCETVATLTSGPIIDINVITRGSKYDVTVETFTDRQTIKLRPCTLCFIYCLDDGALLASQDDSVQISLNAGHLMQLEQPNCNLQVNGENMLVVHLAEIG